MFAQPSTRTDFGFHHPASAVWNSKEHSEAKMYKFLKSGRNQMRLDICRRIWPELEPEPDSVDVCSIAPHADVMCEVV